MVKDGDIGKKERAGISHIDRRRETYENQLQKLLEAIKLAKSFEEALDDNGLLEEV